MRHLLNDREGKLQYLHSLKSLPTLTDTRCRSLPRFADHHSDEEKPRPRKNPKLAPERNISKLEDSFEANFEPDYELGGDSD